MAHPVCEWLSHHTRGTRLLLAQFNDVRYFLNFDKLLALGWKPEVDFDQGERPMRSAPAATSVLRPPACYIRTCCVWLASVLLPRLFAPPAYQRLLTAPQGCSSRSSGTRKSLLTGGRSVQTAPSLPTRPPFLPPWIAASHETHDDAMNAIEEEHLSMRAPSASR